MSYFSNYGDAIGDMGEGTFALPSMPTSGRGIFGESARIASLKVTSEDGNNVSYEDGWLITKSTTDGVKYGFKSKKDGKIKELSKEDYANIVGRFNHDKQLLRDSPQFRPAHKQNRIQLIGDRAVARAGGHTGPWAVHPVNDTFATSPVQSDIGGGGGGGSSGGDPASGDWHTFVFCDSTGSPVEWQVWSKPA